MKFFKLLIIGVCFLSLSCEKKVEYKIVTEEEYIKDNYSYYLGRLPQGTKIVEVLKSLDEREAEWLIVKIKESYFLYRYNRDSNATTEVMVPINYKEKDVDTDTD